jgi:hypothetical protein
MASRAPAARPQATPISYGSGAREIKRPPAGFMASAPTTVHIGGPSTAAAGGFYPLVGMPAASAAAVPTPMVVMTASSDSLAIDDVFTRAHHLKVFNWPDAEMNSIGVIVKPKNQKPHFVRIVGENSDGSIRADLCFLNVESKDKYGRINYDRDVAKDSEFVVASHHIDQFKFYLSRTFGAQMEERRDQLANMEKDRLIKTHFAPELVYQTVAHPLTVQYFKDMFGDQITSFNTETMARMAVPRFQDRLIWWKTAIDESVNPMLAGTPEFREELFERLHHQPFFALFPALADFFDGVIDASNHEGDFPTESNLTSSKMGALNFKFNSKMFHYARQVMVPQSMIDASPIKFGEEGLLPAPTGYVMAVRR